MAEHVTPSATRRPAALRMLSAAEAVAGGLLLALIFVLVLTQALQRYLPGGGWVWTGELARYGLVWMTFAMCGHLTARDGHITLKLIDTVARGRLLRLVRIFANAMVAVVCLNLAYEAYTLVTSDSPQVSPAMEMPLRWFYVIPLAGLVLTAVRSVVAVFLPEPEPDGPPVHASGPESEESGGSGRTKGEEPRA
ncbi:TRAP transporter small permease [Streptomyces sp. MNU89]|uniref:TRAP transporter small permease n=1 Tax=Streptomyces sp. MNU89 TaxID=2560025 RepID=UPI001E4016E1|nr:TRAP transporter small permease [Streptomyces sp. MNU89]MCC9741158.1 TRAP transporter small permease [Streptomyces sp. MNU89]